MERYRWPAGLWATLLIAWLGGVSRCHAEIVHFRMTGRITVDYQVGDLPDGIYEGAPFRVDLSYDTTTPDSYYADDPQRGLYPTEVGPNNYLRFRAGPAEISAHDLWLLLGNNIDGYPQPGDNRPLWDLPGDYFQAQSQIIANFPIPTYHKIGFAWRDSSGAAFESDSLPVQLSLNGFEDTWFTVTTSSTGSRINQFTIRGLVGEIAKVPEPSAAGLAVLSAMLVSSRARRRTRTYLIY